MKTDFTKEQKDIKCKCGHFIKLHDWYGGKEIIVNLDDFSEIESSGIHVTLTHLNDGYNIVVSESIDEIWEMMS